MRIHSREELVVNSFGNPNMPSTSSPPSTPTPTQLPWAPAELLPGAASCSSSDHHRWAVQAMASGYSASQLTPFIASARRVMRSHEVDLLLFSNSESLELQRLAEQHAVSLVKFLQRPPRSNMPSFSLMLNPVAWRFVLASALIKVRTSTEYRGRAVGPSDRAVKLCRNISFVCLSYV